MLSDILIMNLLILKYTKISFYIIISLVIIMKKNVVLIYRIVLAIIIFIGLIFNYLAKNYDLNMFLSYYTVQSNIIVLIILLLQIINHFKQINLFREEHIFQNIKGAGTIIILITGIIFITLLTKYTKDWSGYRLISSYLLHYISPLMVLIDYLFFDNLTKKLNYKKTIIWLVYPLCYYLFGIFRILFIDGFIPYPFMDIKGLGFFKSFGIITGLIIFFYILSMLICVLKNAINKNNYKNN